MTNEKVKEMALVYYPKLWNESRIKALVIAKQLSESDYEEITGNKYDV